MADTEMLTSTDLKSRGWTDAMIEQYLPSPDKTKQNQHHRSGPRINLYCQKRVCDIEKTEDFMSRKTAAEKRQISSRKGVDTKRKQLLDAVAKIEIEVPLLKNDVLIEAAVEHYNARNSDRSTELPRADKTSDQKFLDRISVNFLRHVCTKYEEELDKLFGKVGAGDAYPEIKEKVLNAIGDQYPHLFAECSRQIDLPEEEQGKIRW